MGTRGPLIAFILLMVAGIVGTVYFGLRPRPMSKIKLSSVASPQIMSNMFLSQLQLEVQSNPLLLVGVDPTNEAHIEFAQQLAQIGDPVLAYTEKIISAELQLDSSFPEFSKTLITEAFLPVADHIRRQLAERKRVIVLLPNVHSAQYVAGGFAWRLLNESKIPAMSISLVDFPRNRSEEKSMHIPCVVEGVDTKGPGPLGCLILQKARASYRKLPKEKGPFVGMLDQIGSNDYLALFQSK